MFTKILAVADKNGEKEIKFTKKLFGFFFFLNTSHGLVFESVGDGAYSIIFRVWNCQNES